MTYVLGGELTDGTVITPKYVGPRRLVEVAVATLATDRALLLLGLPGSEDLGLGTPRAAISGTSTLLVQGTSGTAEESIRYGWNYARLLAEGPSSAAIVPSPVLTAMREGKIARIEELTRSRRTSRTPSSPSCPRRRSRYPSSAPRSRRPRVQ